MLMEERGKKDSQPFLLKLGFALAISLAGFFVSHFRSKSQISDDDGSKKSSANNRNDDLHILTSEEAFAKVINGTSTTNTKTSTLADEEEFLLTEFNNGAMNEFEVRPDSYNVKLFEKGLEFEVRDEMEKEIAYLRNLVEALKERERNFEIPMTEYYGLREQEALLRELENRLKVSATERKLLILNIQSLRVENQKLQAQVSDYPSLVLELESAREEIRLLKEKLKADGEEVKEKLAASQVSNYPKLVVELESAREEVRLLKEKLKADGEEAKEKLAAFHRRITEMLDRDHKNVVEDVGKLKRLKELEDEVMDLRKVNSRLAEENLKFVELLESMNMEAASHPNPREVEAMEVASNLREENENLKKEMEQLQTDRCTDVEELVYLRWINACLRYELRNYQAPPGKTVARDLSKCLSPESEKKAKQLILEYADSGVNAKNVSLSHFDFDTESCTSSQTSAEECGDISFESAFPKQSGSSISKLITKFRRLVLGKAKKRSKVDPFDDTNGKRNSSDSVASCVSVENASVKQQKIKESVADRRKSDVGTATSHMRMISRDHLSDLGCDLDSGDAGVPEKVKLKKFADALKGSVKSKGRSASIG